MFALLFGFTSRRITAPLRLSLISLIEAIVATMLVIVRWVLWLATAGASAVSVGAQLDAGVFGTLLLLVCAPSTLAAMPATIEAAPALGLTDETAGVVLPLAASVFRAVSAAANVAVAIYLAHFHGIALGPSALVVVALIGAVVSLAAVGLPAQAPSSPRPHRQPRRAP